MQFRFITVVWGDAFVARFLRLALRSLYAPDNLPWLARRYRTTYSIYTTAEGAEKIRAHPLYRAKPPELEIEFHTFSTSEIDIRNSSSHWILWKRAFITAAQADEHVVTVAADHIFERSAIKRWSELFAAGHLAIFSPGIQVALETVEDELARRFAGDMPIELAAAELGELMFRHLHPVNITMFRDSPRWMRHPEYHLRDIDGAAMAQNILASHAVAFRPAHIQVNDNFCPVEKIDKIAFEPSAFLSAEPMMKFMGQYFRRWTMDDRAMSHYGSWGDIFFSPANIRESYKTHVYPRAGNVPQARRERAARSSLAYVSQMQLSRKFFRLWRMLHKNGLPKAAACLAAGHMLTRLRRNIPLQSSATIFVPRESAFARLAPGEIERLVGTRDRLLGTLRSHIAGGTIQLPRNARLKRVSEGGFAVADGQRYAADPRGIIRTIGNPLQCDDVTIYIVNRPMIDVAMSPPSTAEWAGNAARRLSQAAKSRYRAGRSRAIRLLLASPPLARLTLALRSIIKGSQIEQKVSSTELLTALRRPFMARAHATLCELYDFYERKFPGLMSEPAKLIRDIPAPDAVDACARVARDFPDSAEPWLELGFAHLDLGDDKAAFEAFARVRENASGIGRRSGDPAPQVLAAIERVGILIRWGHTTEALHEIEMMPKISPLPWLAHQRLGELLLSQGRGIEALAAAERAIERDSVEPVYDRLLPLSPSELREALSATRRT